MSFGDWLLALHLLSALALVAFMVLFWIVIVAARNVDDVDQTLAFGRVTNVGGRLVGVGFGGTTVFGVILAFDMDSYAIWDGWIIAAIVLWAIGGATGGRAGTEYAKAVTGKPA